MRHLLLAASATVAEAASAPNAGAVTGAPCLPPLLHALSRAEGSSLAGPEQLQQWGSIAKGGLPASGGGVGREGSMEGPAVPGLMAAMVARVEGGQGSTADQGGTAPTTPVQGSKQGPRRAEGGVGSGSTSGQGGTQGSTPHAEMDTGSTSPAVHQSDHAPDRESKADAGAGADTGQGADEAASMAKANGQRHSSADTAPYGEMAESEVVDASMDGGSRGVGMGAAGFSTDGAPAPAAPPTNQDEQPLHTLGQGTEPEGAGEGRQGEEGAEGRPADGVLFSYFSPLGASAGIAGRNGAGRYAGAGNTAGNGAGSLGSSDAAGVETNSGLGAREGVQPVTSNPGLSSVEGAAEAGRGGSSGEAAFTGDTEVRHGGPPCM